MKSDNHSLQGAGNQHSPAPLSTVTCPVTREQCSEPICCSERMCQISEVHPNPNAIPEPIAHGRVIHVVRGNELERQLAKTEVRRRWALVLGFMIGVIVTLLVVK